METTNIQTELLKTNSLPCLCFSFLYYVKKKYVNAMFTNIFIQTGIRIGGKQAADK